MKSIPEERVKKQVPNTQRAEKGLTLRKLLKSTPPMYKEHARDIVVKQMNTQAMTKGGMPAITAVCITTDRKKPTPHRCSIISLDRPDANVSRKRLKVNKATKVLVSCDCESFCFSMEYANWTWGASKIKYCNGDPARVTNPSNTPMMCKHLVAVARTIIEHDL